jgi:ankyrin repeat protein
MELLDLSRDVLRQIMIHYIDNSEVNKIKVNFIGSKILNEINNDIKLDKSPLYDALKKYDMLATENLTSSQLIELINNDYNYVDVNGYTSLMLAFRYNLMDVASEILNHGYSPEQVNINGETSLIFGCQFCCHVDTKILDMDCKPEQVNDQHYTALILACIYKKSEVAIKLLNLNCVPGQIDSYSNTALIYACMNNETEVALKLLNLGNICEPNYINLQGSTALLFACQNKMSEVALKLLDLNCDPTCIDNYNQTALTYACQNDMSDVITKIIQRTSF